MKINRLRYGRLYGHLSGDVSFGSGQNFIVGVNGCGKTAALNAIRWVLTPSIPDLCTLPHDYIEVWVLHEHIEYQVSSRIEGDRHILSIAAHGEGAPRFNDIVSPLEVRPIKIRSKEQRVDLREDYAHLGPEEEERETWAFLCDVLPSPIYVGLERKIDGDVPDSRQRGIRVQLGKRMSSAPIKAAEDFLRSAHSRRIQKLVRLNDELNKDVLELSFASEEMLRKGISRPFHFDEDRIQTLKRKFRFAAKNDGYSKALSSEKVSSAIVSYLDNLADQLRAALTGGLVEQDFNARGFFLASKMFDLLGAHEKKVSNIHREIESFSDAVCMFLGDSGKVLDFDSATGSPYFRIKDFSAKVRLEDLSSGESQVVVLLSFLAFLAKSERPVIVDEPELSLHVEWQRRFVSAVQKVMSHGAQSIMATHSPEMCGAPNVNVVSLMARPHG